MSDVAVQERRSGVIIRREKGDEPRVSLAIVADATGIPSRLLRGWLDSGHAWIESESQAQAHQWRGLTLADNIRLAIQSRMVFDLGLPPALARRHLVAAFHGHWLAADQPSNGDQVARRLRELKDKVLLVSWDEARMTSPQIKKLAVGRLDPIPTLAVTVHFGPIIAATLSRLRTNARLTERQRAFVD